MDTNELLAEHDARIMHVARTFYSRCPVVDADDLAQVGRIKFCECIARFNTSRGRTLWEFARVAVRNAMIDELRRWKRTSQLTFEPFCLPVFEQAIDDADFIDFAMRALNEKQRRVMQLVREGRTTSEAAAELGTSTVTVWRTVLQSKRVIQKVGQSI